MPGNGFVGTDIFTYEANDGQANSNVATETITVTQGITDRIYTNGFEVN